MDVEKMVNELFPLFVSGKRWAYDSLSVGNHILCYGSLPVAVYEAGIISVSNESFCKAIVESLVSLAEENGMPVKRYVGIYGTGFGVYFKLTEPLHSF